jgi:hypothetical protein
MDDVTHCQIGKDEWRHFILLCWGFNFQIETVSNDDDDSHRSAKDFGGVDGWIDQKHKPFKVVYNNEYEACI